jgi:PLD-like domain
MSGTSDRNWLNTAEYISIACSAAGSVAAVASQQLIYAAAPLTLAMSISLANRQRFQHQFEQQAEVISNVRQETQSLHSRVHSLPSTNQVSLLEASVTKLEQVVFDTNTQQQLNALVEAFNNRAELEEIGSLHKAVSSLRDCLVELPSPTVPFDPSPLTLEIAALTERLDRLPITVFQQQLREVKDLIEDLDASSADLHDRTRNVERMQQDLKTLQHITCSLDEKATQLESRIDKFESIEQQLDNLQQLTTGYIRADDFDSLRAKLSQDVAGQVEATIEQRVAQLNHLLKEIQPKYEYRLVCDRDQSRALLLKAAKEANERLILVCPWLHWGIRWNHGELLHRFHTLLGKPNCSIDIGWGHYYDMENDKVRYSSTSLRQSLVNHCKMYTALPQLEKLEKDYPEQFKLKLLGTHEKFLVCDHSWAMIGSHNFLSSGDKSQEREVGLWTNDPYIIDSLIKRFESAKNLEGQQVHLAIAS